MYLFYYIQSERGSNLRSAIGLIVDFGGRYMVLRAKDGKTKIWPMAIRLKYTFRAMSRAKELGKAEVVPIEKD